jgi:exodeoxyribonuclease VII small subunit
MTFSESSKRLNEIARRLEEPDVTLDESIALFEESVRLSSECMDILKTKKGKITEIKKELDKLIETDFDGKK